MISTEVLPKEPFQELADMEFPQFANWKDEFMARLSNLPPNRLVLLLEVLGVPVDGML